MEFWQILVMSYVAPLLAIVALVGLEFVWQSWLWRREQREIREMERERLKGFTRAASRVPGIGHEPD